MYGRKNLWNWNFKLKIDMKVVNFYYIHIYFKSNQSNISNPKNKCKEFKFFIKIFYYYLQFSIFYINVLIRNVINYTLKYITFYMVKH